MIIDFNKYSMGGGGSGGGSGSDPEAVKYTAQSLTDAQKAQARTNIGAYRKPDGGIPSTDLADPESVFIIPVDTDTETVDPSITHQDIADAYAAGKLFAFKSSSSPTRIMYATAAMVFTGGIAIYASDAGVSNGSLIQTIWAISSTPSGNSFVVEEEQIEVPEISTDIGTDATSDTKTASPKAVADYVNNSVPVVPVDTAIPSGGLDANVHYALGTLTGSVSITLDTTTEVSGQMNIYSLAFTAGSTAPTITWPSGITSWAGNCLDSNGAPVITAGNSYEVSIVDGMAVITEFVA